MDPEKQKQIIGYFIEEASDHINTIESSLVNLQETLADPEMMNEVFRAAHSIKGGAAMLGFTDMQHVSHNLEDSFKVLKDHPDSKVDQDLQSLLLYGLDTLKELLQQIQSPSEVNEQIAQEALANSEPLFAQLKTQISSLVSTAIAPTNSLETTEYLEKSLEETRAMTMVFRTDVPAKLRDMLQIFKNTDRPTSRQQLLDICNHLAQMGEQFDLGVWDDLVQMVKIAIANSQNSFRILAPIVIKEIKQAQEAVLGQQPIVISPKLRALMPLPEREANIHGDDEVSYIFGEFIPDINWQKFGDRVQWRVNNAWVKSAKVNFSSSAPEGHLPAPIWLSEWNQNNSEKLHDQVQKWMTKIDQCIS